MSNTLRIAALIFIGSAAFLFGGCGQKSSVQADYGLATHLAPVGDRGAGFVSYGHAKYGFELYFPDSFVEGDLTPTVMGSFGFPESYTTGTNLSQAAVFINRKTGDCTELGYGRSAKTGWHNGKKIILDPIFKEKIYVGDVEFNRTFCSRFDSGYYIDALVYTTERLNEPISLSLVLVAADPNDVVGAAGTALYDPKIFEEEFVKIIETYKYYKDNIEE